MRHGDVQLLGGQSACEGGVGVAIHQHAVGLLCHQHFLDALHHAARERAVGKRVDVEVVVGLAQPHLLEEELRHVAVEMLSRVDDNLLKVIVLR